MRTFRKIIVVVASILFIVGLYSIISNPNTDYTAFDTYVSPVGLLLVIIALSLTIRKEQRMMKRN